MDWPPIGAGIVSPVTAPEWKTLTLKSNLCSLLALLESVAEETLANNDWPSPVVASQEINIGLLVDEAAILPKLTLVTVVSPAVGEPRCTRLSVTWPEAEPVFATTILTTC